MTHKRKKMVRLEPFDGGGGPAPDSPSANVRNLNTGGEASATVQHENGKVAACAFCPITVGDTAARKVSRVKLPPWRTLGATESA